MIGKVEQAYLSFIIFIVAKFLPKVLRIFQFFEIDIVLKIFIYPCINGLILIEHFNLTI